MPNGHLERFNGKFRDECHNQHWFLHLDDARWLIEHRRVDYHTVRPHRALGDMTPATVAQPLTAGGKLSFWAA